MPFSSTPGCDPLSVVVDGPSSLLAEGPGRGFLPLLAGVRRLRWWWWRVSLGLGGGFPVLCVFVAREVACIALAFVCFVCLWCLCWCWCGWCGVGCVSPVRWCACVCEVGVSLVFGCLSSPISVGARGSCLCGCGWCVLWVVPRHSWLMVLGEVPRTPG